MFDALHKRFEHCKNLKTFMGINDSNQFSSLFFTNFNENDFFNAVPFDKYGIIGKGFQSNLQSVVSILYIPVTLSKSRTKLLMFDQIYTQEAILNAPNVVFMSSKSKEELEEERENSMRISIENSHRRFFEELKSPAGAKKFWNITLEFLEDCLNNNDDLKLSAKEVLKQSTVLLWGSFEVLARDILVSYLNKFPERYKLIGNKNISVEILDKYGFNVQQNLGNIFADSHDWSNLTIIKDTYKNLFPDNENVNSSLRSIDLYKLNKRRHLIVHNRGIVDKRYREITNDNFEIGAELLIHPDELSKSLEIVRDIGSNLLEILTD